MKRTFLPVSDANNIEFNCSKQIIISDLFVFLGSVAVVYSCLSENSASYGDMEKARAHGKRAQELNLVSIVLGVIILIVNIGLLISLSHND